MYLYIDAETEVSRDLTLTKMTIRQYLARAKVLSVAFAQGDNPVTCSLSTDPDWRAIIAGLQGLVEAGAIVVAHNASFDVRVLTQSLGIPWPSKIHCTMEMAQGWSPNQPGGYGLDNLTKIWAPNHGKQKINLQDCTPDELRAYNAQDVVACRALHKIALARMHPDEIRVMELTQNVKEIVFSVDQAKISDAVTAFDLQVAQHGVDAAAILGKSSSYGEDDDGSIRSVKPHALRAALLETLGFDTPTISMKKINPENLRQNPDAAKVLESSAKMNKALSHKRRVRAFAGATEIDAELTYFAAHTGRWSSRNSGRGLNLHNCVSVGIPLLTDRGWISILTLTPGDKVWDGTEFVSHQGVRLSPRRALEPSIAACKVTAEHPVWTGDRMLARAALSPSLRVQSSAAGLCSLMRAAVKFGSAPGVMDAVLCSLGQSQGYIRAAAADLAATTPGTTTTAGGLIAPCSDLFGGDTTICFTDTAPKGMESFDSWETKCALAGATSLPSSREYESMLAGMIQACTWIGSTARNCTDPVTLGSCLRWITRAIVALQSALPREKSLLITPNGLASSTSPPTTDGARDALYDVLGAGPRARYQAGGLIVSNCPKRNPAVAKPFRSLFRLPADLCFVRGDFSNIEYRVECLLTKCQYGADMFTANPLADPYAEFWTAATGQKIDKTVKADQSKRQLAKAAVLALGYSMGQQRWTHELATALADPGFKLSLADLEQVCAANNWTLPADQRTRLIMGKLRCPPAVASVAYYTREKFHQVHPEFGRCARHIEHTIQRAMGMSYDQKQSQRILDGFQMQPAIVLTDDRGLQGQTIRAKCGPWPAQTIAWRDLLIRQTPIGTGPTFVRAGNKPVAKFSINTGIENLVQSAARNALCMGLLELDRRGFPYVLHVHDEVMIVTERTCAAVNTARQALLDVFGPGGWISRQGWEWSVLINPKETTISQSLWDDEHLSQTLWPRIAAGDDAALENLT